MTDYLLLNPGGDIAAPHHTESGYLYRRWTPDPPIKLQEGETPLEAFRRNHLEQFGEPHRVAGHRFVETELPHGRYYPRIARPSGDPITSDLTYPFHELPEKEIAASRGQLVYLMGELKEICQTIHPCEDNLKAYGHAIRNLLILACTEAETQWKAVLLANGFIVKRRRNANVLDYVKLVSVMRLNEFSISLSHYPWLPAIKPFERWSLPADGNEADGLSWYRAYNMVKHDREGNFSKGTLGDAFLAICACAVMLKAQFGSFAFWSREELSSFFFVSNPRWPHECSYVRPNSGAQWIAVKHPDLDCSLARRA